VAIRYTALRFNLPITEIAERVGYQSVSAPIGARTLF
jgi:AraC-like DNA-binding protein